MPLRISFITLFILSLNRVSLMAQDRVIIKLDEGRTPIINENFGTHKYNQILTTGKDSSSISKIYDLKNRMVSQSKEKYNEELGYNEAITSEYDTLQNLISSEIKNIENGSFVKVFVENEVVISRLEYISNQDYKFYLGNSDTVFLEGEKNPMVLQLKYDLSDYHKFLAQNLKYPYNARERKEMGTVLLKLDINKEGEVIQITCINEDEIYEPLIKEARRVVEKFNPQFIAPINSYGEKTNAIVKVPIRFKIS